MNRPYCAIIAQTVRWAHEAKNGIRWIIGYRVAMMLRIIQKHLSFQSLD
jgi:hypothetical protein